MTDQASPRQPFLSPWLWVLLGASLALRVTLALHGGQRYSGDELRYDRGPILLNALWNGEWDWVQAVVKEPVHAGFSYVALLVAPFHHALATLLGFGDWSHPENIQASLSMAAIVMGLFSTLNLWLVYQLSLRSGASRSEAGFVMLFAAAANSLFYYSRHLVPYDSSLTLALCGLIFSVSGTTRFRQFLAGSCAALSFQIYNGYWFLVPVLGLTLLFSQSGWSARFRVGCIWILGAVGTTLLVISPGIIISGRDFWLQSAKFSHSVTQGLFAEGWSLPWAYLWAAEGWLGVGLAIILIAVSIRDLFNGTLPRRIVLWAGVAGAIYTLLVVTSVGLEKFVVYARSTRPLVPCLCLVAGYAVNRLLTPHPRWRPAVVVAVIVAASANFAPNFVLIYPPDIKSTILKNFGSPKQTISFTGSYYFDPVQKVTRPDLVLLNAQGLYPLKDYIEDPKGKVLFSAPHPLQFVPYQYDGYTPRERRLMKEHPPFIKLIKLDDPNSMPNNPPVSGFLGIPEIANGRDQGRK